MSLIGTVSKEHLFLAICGINMSRYDNSEEILHKGAETKARLRGYSWLITKPLMSDISTFKVTTQNAGAPRRIAHTLYGDHNLFWILVAFNNKWYFDPGALNVLNWPVAGQIIYYPKRYVIAPTLT